MALFVLALSSGCTLLPAHHAPVPRPLQSQSAPFAMNGRISINDHGEHHSAGLHWSHSTKSDDILLLTPLGQTAARVYRDDGHATLDDGDKHYQADDTEALMKQVLGWYLPLGELHQWVLGLPDTGSPAQIERNSDGQIGILHQDGWEVRFLRYADSKPDSLPTRLQLNHEDLSVQLLIDEWDWDPK